MQAGVSKCVITPPMGVALAGFGRPDRFATGIYDDLYLSVIALSQDNDKVVIICADLIGFGSQLVAGLKKELGKKFGLREDQVLFCASHTHSGPETLENMNPHLGGMDGNYISFLRGKVLSTVEASLSSMEDVDIYLGKSRCSIGINRRLIINGKCNFAPNEEGPTNDEVIVLKVMKGEKVKAVLFNYACHPSTINTENVSSDYPGGARNVIEAEFGDNVVAMFIQGCCGDIRVRTIKDNIFRAGTIEDVDRFGRELGKSVLEACSEGMVKINPTISSGLVQTQLKLQAIPAKEEYRKKADDESSYTKVWAETMYENYTSLKNSIPFSIQKITLGDIVIIALEGEVCVDYSLNMKKLYGDKTVITAGYSNGVVGYIPTEPMFEQGGYEPRDSIACYSLPSQFLPDIEANIFNAIKKLG